MNVLVIGDVIIDRYTHGTRRGISAETPTIVANYQRQDVFVGGAGLVVRNLLRLGDQVTLLTVGQGSGLTVMFRGSTDPISDGEWKKFFLCDVPVPGWSTTDKHRYFVEQYKLLQYDQVNRGTWTPFAEDSFVRDMRKLVEGRDAVVICDNRHGVMTPHIAKQVILECKKRKVKVYVDSQISQSESNHEWYKGADFVFLNEYETDCVAKKAKKKEKSLLGTVSKFLRSHIVYKRGERGAIVVPLVDGLGKTIVSEGFKVDAVDTCGAGDALMAAFVHYDRDLEAANRWAALSTTYKGTIVPKLEDLKKVTR